MRYTHHMVTVVDENSPRLSDEEFRIFRDFIHRKAGIYFHDSKRFFLEHRLRSRLRTVGAETFSHYFMTLQQKQEIREFNNLIDSVTTTETSFYRNRPQMDAFRSVMLPDLLKRRSRIGSGPVRIWSAGCSSGEEPYTLAMLALETRRRLDTRVDVEILACDINETALKYAQRGVYSSEGTRSLPADLLNRYLEPVGGGYRICDDLKDMIVFQRFNLAEEGRYLRMGQMDVVFCRNVLIYFGEAVRRRVLKAMADILKDDGFLFTGHSENPSGLNPIFEPVRISGRPICYRLKRGPGPDRLQASIENQQSGLQRID